MKKLILSFALLCSTMVWSQSKSVILSPNYIEDITISPIPTTLPTVLPTDNNPYNGYDGIPAQGAQNIITGTDGKIIFFVIDQFIYGRNGQLIDVMTYDHVVPSPWTSTGFEVQGVNAQTAVVPVPGSCEDYYIISTNKWNGDNSNSPAGTKTFYGKLNIKYDANDNLVSGSGLMNQSNDPILFPEDKMRELVELAGTDWEEHNNIHDANQFFSVTKELNSERFLFVAEHRDIYRFKLTQTGIQYDGKIAISSMQPNTLINSSASPSACEMEVISLSNGNLRMALPVRSEILSGNQIFEGYLICDFDENTGNFLGNQKQILFNRINNYTDELYFKGAEFSRWGDKFYITHAKNSNYSSTFDFFDLNTANTFSTRQIISNLDKYANSHIERIAGDKIIIPTQTKLELINNATNPVFPTDLNTNFSNLTAYNSVSLFSPAAPNNLTRLLQNQVDDMDYVGYLIDGVECCISNSIYDKLTFAAQTSATWSPGVGMNPIASNTNGTSTVTVRDELRIKAGVTITINNMIFEFAPNAKVIIEQGVGTQQGGKLILNGTTFTADTRCTNDLWLGVEVWGNQSNSQGNINNSTQGRFIVLNNSNVEHAYIGALASKRTSLFSFDDARNGGIIQVHNSKMLNNQRSIWFRKYIANANNLSYVYNSDLKWTQNLFGGHSVQTHITLETVKGISIKGSRISNEIVGGTNVEQGFGLIARQSMFNVGTYCSTITPFGTPCPSPIKTEFKNLNYGVHATNGTDDRTYSIDNSLFSNCAYGIYTFGTNLERITSNVFEVREATPNQTAGGAIYNSTGYTIENNIFYEFDKASITNGTGNSYGLVINSSGTTHNEVYRNTFYNLKVGGQSEKINGSPIANPNNTLTTGLQWKCNTFKDNIYLTDLGVNGVIDYQQGYPDVSSLQNARIKSARNEFSMFGEDPILLPEHDIMIYPTSQQINYVHLNNPEQTPDNFTLTHVYLSPAMFLNQPVYGGPNDCPSKLNIKIQTEKQKLAQVKDELTSIKNKLDGGNAQELISLINNSVNHGLTKNILLEKSPYLSDLVLITYTQSTAPSAMRKDVLLANSSLSDMVLQTIANSNLPIGTKNQIYTAQNGVSERNKIEILYSYYNGEYESYLNDILSQYFLNENDEYTFEEIEEFLESINTNETTKTLYDLYLSRNDFTKANVKRNQLVQMQESSTYFLLQDIKEIIRPVPTEELTIAPTEQAGQDLEYLTQNGETERVKASAKAILELRDGSSEVPDFLPLFGPSAMMLNQSEENSNEDIKIQEVVSMYPNPSTGQVYFDYPELGEGTLVIQLLDLNGKEVYTYHSDASSNGELVDLSHLHKGLYLTRISIDGTFIETQKLFLK